ncbi:PhoH family protein [Ammonifex thiophilus]|uniref:PhoH-like protein n=2 Tax=Ammonifex thiophilus TaxID=444093 RepID=A0A3D8P541_9THEO|nr:PhoH family protein [Ammonifex thiophilus]
MEEIRIPVEDQQAAMEILGRFDEHLKAIERATGVQLLLRGGEFVLRGEPHQVREGSEVLYRLKDAYRTYGSITMREVNQAIRAAKGAEKDKELVDEILLTTPRGKQVRPKTPGQKRYVDAIRRYDITFAIGPAGTGKTYLAVVMAVIWLRQRRISRIILTRPAVEAGEKLGFLPGRLEEKVDPYLRPLYDSLYDVLGVENTERYLERRIIEIAPLAYMRGRTLEDAFIILDEAQNTTPEQMKMFLTRLGFGSKAVITGDITQIDLPRGQESGLVVAQRILQGIEGISFQYLTGEDTIRHPLVMEIIRAYERAEAEKAKE